MIQFQASGLTFAALKWGPADGPLALCLHGYPDTAWTWRHLGPHLAAGGWRVVAPFMRGYAPTDLAPDGIYQAGAFVRDAVDAHAALGGDERAVLIGHDWGAAFAYGIGSYAPERFARVVTLAVPPPATLAALQPRSDAWLALRQMRRSWYMLYQQLPVISERSLPRLIPLLWRQWSPGYDAGEDIEHARQALAGEHATAALRPYRAMLQPWTQAPEYRAEQRHWLRVPSQPCLYLHGREDRCLLADVAERARGLLPDGSRVEIVPGAGHFLQLERPEVVNDLIATFIGPAAR